MEGITAYALSKGYTKETASSLGSLKGAPCTVENVEQKDGYAEITLGWTGTDGKHKSSSFIVNDGVSITSADQIIDDVSPSGHKAFSSQKVLSLLANRLSTKEVNTLPVSDIRSDTIYLVPSGEPGVYDQFIYDDGTWQSLGNTSPNFENKADSEAVNAELEKKVDKENGKGLSTNDLTDLIKQKYDDAADKSHEHENKVILDRLSASKTGVLCYDGKEVTCRISKESGNSVELKEDGLYVNTGNIIYRNQQAVDSGKKWYNGKNIYIATVIQEILTPGEKFTNIKLPSKVDEIISYNALCYFETEDEPFLHVYNIPCYNPCEDTYRDELGTIRGMFTGDDKPTNFIIRQNSYLQGKKLIFTMEYTEQ